MTYRGHVENGKVILQEGAHLPDGTEVKVQAMKTRKKSDRGKQLSPKPTVSKGLLALAGKARGLPPDAARNLDHYLYGHPKQ